MIEPTILGDNYKNTFILGFAFETQYFILQELFHI